jgi:Ser-tRNA(Ala) deacylase AlaX
MPDEISFSVVITIAAALFSAGITWGVMRSKVAFNSETLKELKEAVTELKTLVLELHVLKASNMRNEQAIANHEQRIFSLELKIGQLVK